MTGMIASMIDGVRRRLAAAVLWGALAAVALALIAMCITAAIVFALLAVYLLLAGQFPPPAAAAITAGIAGLAAVTIADVGVVAFRIATPPRWPATAAKPEPQASAATLGPLGAAADQAAGWIEKNPLGAVIAAFATGTMFAISPPLRRAAVDLIAAIIRPPPPRDP